MRQISADEPYQLPGPPGYTLASQEEKEINLRDYWKVIRKRRWTIIAFFLIVLVTTAIGTFTMRPVYRGTCTIQIDKENLQIVDFKEIFSMNMWDQDYYQTQYKILESRSLARRVIGSLKLPEHPEFVPSPPGPFEKWKSQIWDSISIVTNVFSSSKDGPSTDADRDPLKDMDAGKNSLEVGKETGLINAFLSRLKVEPIRNSRLVKVHYDSHYPELSSQAANNLATNYISQNLEHRFNATEQAKDWLATQIEMLKAKVERADEALQAFGSKHDILSLEEKENVTMRRLMELNEAMAKAEADRMAKEAVHRQTRDRNSDSLSLIMDNKLIMDLKQSFIQLETQYMKLSETYKPEYPEMIRLKKQMETLQKRMDGETDKIVSGIRSDYESALRRESLVRAAFEQQKAKAMEMKDDSIQYNILKREADTNRDLYRDLLQRVKQAGVSASMTASNIKVVDRAEVPGKPFKPNKQMNLLLAAVVGLFLGVGLAFFFEYLDNTVKTPEDVEGMLRLPSFGMVPEISCERKKRLENGPYYPVELVTHGHPKSILSEAYRNIRTSILLSISEHPPKTLAVSSANPFEGKTTTVVNTAIALSQTGVQVLVIDADLRKPRIHKVFEEENEVGLSSYLSGNAALESIIRKSEVPNLYFIAAGPLPPNPSELLGSNRFKTMLQSLREKFEHVIFDSPPILGFADTVILSTAVDGVILVALGGKTPRETLQHAKDILLSVNAKILGVVINRVDIQRSDYGYYYYRYYYYYGKEGRKKKELPFDSREERIST